MTELRSRRLVLRRCRPDDRDDFVALERDPEVMRYLHGGAVDHGQTRPEDVTFLMPRGTEPEVWTARHSGDGAFVGWFCLFEDTVEQAEIGYRLCRGAWGQGLAVEGAALLIDWGFQVGGYDRIVACTMAVNQPSRRVMERLGMTHSRTDQGNWPDPIPGAEEGEVWYQLDRSAWRAGPA